MSTAVTPADEMDRAKLWPALPFAEWKETCATLHMWTQIVGKIRLALCRHGPIIPGTSRFISRRAA